MNSLGPVLDDGRSRSRWSWCVQPAATASLPGQSVIGRILGDLPGDDVIVGDDTGTFVGVAARRDAGGSADLREERLALQSALARRVVRLAERAPLVVLIDDLQRADEASVATLASLAFGARDQRVLMI